MNVQGRRILVTGASSGIGQATTVKLLAGGARVATFDVVERPGGDQPESCRHWIVDVSDDGVVGEAVREAAEWLGGGIDALLHVAGIMVAQQVAIEDVSLEDWERVISVNLRGVFITVKHVVPHLPESGGALVLVSSEAAFAGSGSYPYGASKGGVHAFALTLENKLGPKGIRVNELAPGSVDTPLLRRSLQDATERMGTSELQDHVMRRWIDPRAVADVLVFLASPAADAVRGTVRTR